MKTSVLIIIVCIGCALAITNERRKPYHKHPNDRSFVGKLLGFESQEHKRKPPVHYKHRKPLKPLPIYPHHYENHEHHYQSHAVKLHHHSAPQKYAIIKKVPYQVKVPVPRPVPVKISVPKPYTVEKKIPVPVRVYVPHPYTVEKKVPYPVKVQVPVPQPYVVERKVPFEVKVPVEKPYIVHVPKPYPVYFDEHGHEIYGHKEHHKEMNGHKMHSGGHKDHYFKGHKEHTFGGHKEHNFDGYKGHKEHHFDGHKENHYDGHKEHHFSGHKEHHYDGHKELHFNGHKEHHSDGHKGYYFGGHKEHKGHLESTPNFNSDFKFDNNEWKLSQDHANNYYFEKKPSVSHHEDKPTYVTPEKESEPIYKWAKPSHQGSTHVYTPSEEWKKHVYQESKPTYPTIKEWQKIHKDDKNIYSTNGDWYKHIYATPQENTIKFEDSSSDSIKFDDSIWAKPQEFSFENALSKSEAVGEAHPTEFTARDAKSLEEQLESLPQPQKLIFVEESKTEDNSKEQDAQLIYGDMNESKGNFKPPTDVFYINPSKNGNVVGSSYNIGSSSENGVVGSSYNIGSSSEGSVIGPSYNIGSSSEGSVVGSSSDAGTIGSNYNIGSTSDAGTIGSNYNIGSSSDGSIYNIGSSSDGSSYTIGSSSDGSSYNIGSSSGGSVVGSSYNIGSSSEGNVAGSSYNTASSSEGNNYKTEGSSEGIKPVKEYPIYVSNINNGKEAKSVEATYREPKQSNEEMNNRSPKMLVMTSSPDTRIPNFNYIPSYDQRYQQYKTQDMSSSPSQNNPSVVYSDMMTTGSEMVPNVYYRSYNEMVPSLNRRYDYVEQPLVKTRKTPAHRAERSMRRMDFEPQVWARPNMIGWTPIANRRYDSPPPGDERS